MLTTVCKQGIGVPSGNLPQFPDFDADHHEIRTLRCLAANLVRKTMSLERKNGGTVEAGVAGSLEAVNDVLVKAIEEVTE